MLSRFRFSPLFACRFSSEFCLLTQCAFRGEGIFRRFRQTTRTNARFEQGTSHIGVIRVASYTLCRATLCYAAMGGVLPARKTKKNEKVVSTPDVLRRLKDRSKNAKWKKNDFVSGQSLAKANSFWFVRAHSFQNTFCFVFCILQNCCQVLWSTFVLLSSSAVDPTGAGLILNEQNDNELIIIFTKKQWLSP